LPIEKLFADSATSLAVFKAPTSSLSVAELANSSRLVPGQKMVVVTNGASSFSARFLETHVTVAQGDEHSLYEADQPRRTFGIQEVGALIPGQAIVTLSGEVAGLWDGSAIVSADIIRTASTLFFDNSLQVRRPLFGFAYRTITKAEGQVLTLPQGTLVTRLTAGGPAVAAGLTEGDIIIQLNDTRVDEGMQLEPLLERIKPGDQVRLTLVRNRVPVTVVLTAGEMR
jgi:S1-C subfamily serine protease